MGEEILKLFDDRGELVAVQISPRLWAELSAHWQPAPPAPPPDHDLAAFAEFEQAWTFPYAYSPAVTCPCGAHCDDWRTEDAFILTNANIGGLLVFHCKGCGGTVRQKFFKDHMATEFSPG